FRRAERLDRTRLPRLLQESSSRNRSAAFRSARSVHVFTGVSRALSVAGRNARPHASGGISRGFLDAIHVWHCRPVSRSKERLTAETPGKWFRVTHGVTGCG